MLIPCRCYTCNKVIGDLWNKYLEYLKNGLSEKEAMDKLGLKRFCCRRMIFSHADIINSIIKY